MKELREQVTLPSHVDVTEAASAALLAEVVAHLAPSLARSVGPIEWRRGDASGVDWTAEGMFDGAFVVVCLCPSSRELSLLVDPRIAAPAQPSAGGAVLAAALAVAIAMGLTLRSFGWGIATFAATVTASVAVDVVCQELRERRRVSNFDPTPWRRRFQAAVSAASSPG